MKIRLIFVIAVLLFFVVVGVVLLCLTIGGLIQAIKSNSWPSVDGVVKTCKLEIDSNEGTSYSAKIAYEYSVNDKKFIGNKIATGSYSSIFESFVREEMKKYPIGKNVKVYYSPDDSSVALLEPGIHFGNWEALFLAFLMFVLPSIVFLRLIKQLQNKDFIRKYF
jgi:hypothetical protein